MYRVTVIAGRRWVYLIRARCAGEAMRYVMRINRNANWLTTSCERAPHHQPKQTEPSPEYVAYRKREDDFLTKALAEARSLRRTS